MEKITQTEIKLSDAAVQMKLALEKSDSEAVFRSCINSFISSARSVTMVMEKESAPIPELKKWYKNEMEQLSQLPVMKFFKEQRTHSIHRASISPKTNSAPILILKLMATKLNPTPVRCIGGRLIMLMSTFQVQVVMYSIFVNNILFSLKTLLRRGSIRWP